MKYLSLICLFALMMGGCASSQGKYDDNYKKYLFNYAAVKQASLDERADELNTQRETLNSFKGMAEQCKSDDSDWCVALVSSNATNAVQAQNFSFGNRDPVPLPQPPVPVKSTIDRVVDGVFGTIQKGIIPGFNYLASENASDNQRDTILGLTAGTTAATQSLANAILGVSEDSASVQRSFAENQQPSFSAGGSINIAGRDQEQVARDKASDGSIINTGPGDVADDGSTQAGRDVRNNSPGPIQDSNNDNSSVPDPPADPDTEPDPGVGPTVGPGGG